MNINWNNAPKQADYYQPATGLVVAAWFYKEDGLYYACLEGKDDWFEEADQENCKEWQWIERPQNSDAESPIYKDNRFMRLAEEAGGARLADNIIQMTKDDLERFIYFVNEGYN